MKKLLITSLTMLLSLNLFSQTEEFNCIYDPGNQLMFKTTTGSVYKSSNAIGLPTQGTVRALTIFVNIIYDLYPNLDPFQGVIDAWPADVNSSINSPTYRPSYMLNLFDTDSLASGNYSGILTRLYAESSFNRFILLSDYIVVNIKQSQITQSSSCSAETLRSAVINYINNTGGLQTCYGHNSIADYDKFTRADYGLEKIMSPDSEIDLVNFLIRNSTDSYGGIKANSGLTNASLKSSLKIKIGNQLYSYSNQTYQGVGARDITNNTENILRHELVHLFLGDNSFHTSGGTTNNTSYWNTFVGKQWGYGLFMGGWLSCNAYERWRLGWRGPSNNAYPIASSNVNSDIGVFAGEKTFTLRDFVAYGDAIRIQLPYKDNPTSSYQYIWLENHQMGKNNRLDYQCHTFSGTCRDFSQAGIYAYYQVGRDIIENATLNLVYLSDEMDNLRMMSAEGNYDLYFLNNTTPSCLYGVQRPTFEYLNPNPLQGVNDQNEVYNTNTSASSFYSYPLHYVGVKYKNGTMYANIPYWGDNSDAFVPAPETKIDISTNPAAVNTLTYYSVRNLTSMSVPSTDRNTRKIYLTGLSIRMIDPSPNSTGMKAYTVKIRWDDYDVKQNVRWTGDIVLKEKLNLLTGIEIALEQSYTPNQINRDPVSGLFAQSTKFTCETGSVFTMNPNSRTLLKDKSSFIMSTGSSLIIQNGAQITVESGSTFIVKQGANLTIQGSGELLIKPGGYLCIEPGANIHLQDFNSAINMMENAILGCSPNLSGCACISTIAGIAKTGAGSINLLNQDIYIQNETITTNRYIVGKNIYVGKDVTSSKPYGNVYIKNGAHVILKAANDVLLKSDVEVETGALFEIKRN